MNVLFLIENAVDTGGNRVILKKIKEYTEDQGNCIEVGYTLRKITKLKDYLGVAKDIFGVYKKFFFIAKINILFRPICIKRFNLVISTGRRCIEFVSVLEDNRHIYLMQHFEVWKTYNSSFFINQSRESGYCNSIDTVKAVYFNNNPDEMNYINNIRKIKNFITVSVYLKDIITYINPLIKSIVVQEPPEISFPHESLIINNFSERKYDLLLFLRGVDFKGDGIVIKILEYYNNTEINIAVVVSLRKIKINKLAPNISFYIQPSDSSLAYLYNNSRIVIVNSLTEGFGAVAREAIKFGSKCISSNTGWVQHSDYPDLYKVYHHKFESYISKSQELLRS